MGLVILKSRGIPSAIRRIGRAICSFNQFHKEFLLFFPQNYYFFSKCLPKPAQPLRSWDSSFQLSGSCEHFLWIQLCCLGAARGGQGIGKENHSVCYLGYLKACIHRGNVVVVMVTQVSINRAFCNGGNVLDISAPSNMVATSHISLLRTLNTTSVTEEETF